MPSYDLRTLWVTNDLGNTLTAVDPATGTPGRTVAVEDPYNMYFTPEVGVACRPGHPSSLGHMAHPRRWQP